MAGKCDNILGGDSGCWWERTGESVPEDFSVGNYHGQTADVLGLAVLLGRRHDWFEINSTGTYVLSDGLVRGACRVIELLSARHCSVSEHCWLVELCRTAAITFGTNLSVGRVCNNHHSVADLPSGRQSSLLLLGGCGERGYLFLVGKAERLVDR